jgi:hypothetical protein
MTTEIDEILAYDLELFIDNTSEIYYRHTVPVLRMISKHYDRGNGSKPEALKAIERYIVLPACKMYISECCAGTVTVRNFTPRELREYVASELFDKYEEGLQDKNSTERYW